MIGERRERVRAERTFAQSLARPLDPHGDDSLSEPETAALWELALHQGEPIGLRFLAEATRDPFTARQLRARSEPAMIAALGLNLEQRHRAAKLLSDKLRDLKFGHAAKVETAFIALELEDRPGPETAECDSPARPQRCRTSGFLTPVPAGIRVRSAVPPGQRYPATFQSSQSEAEWTTGESNPDLLVASQASFRWTSSP